MTTANNKTRLSRFILVVLAASVFGICPGRVLIAGQDQTPNVYATWQDFGVRDGLPHDRIRAIHVFGKDVWVGTDGGLARCRGRAWRAWTTHDGLPWPVINTIDVDEKTQDVWLGTWGGGLVRFSGGRFDRFDQFNSGLAGDLVFAVAVVGDRVWAATNGGLSSFDTIHDSWDLHAERRADAPATAITSLLAHDGGVFTAAWCEGLRYFDPTRDSWKQISRPPNAKASRSSPSFLYEDTTLSIAGAGLGLLWMTQTEFFRRDGSGNWVEQRIPESTPGHGFVHCIAAKDESEVWLGTDGGLLVLVDESTRTWVAYRRSSIGIRGLVTASQNGVPLESRVLDKGLPDNRIRCVAFDDEGVWVGTPVGLARGTNKRQWNSLPLATSDDKTEFDADSTSAGQRRSISPLDLAGRPNAVAASSPQLGAGPDAMSERNITIAVLAKATRTIALPGAASEPKGRGGRVDPWVVQLAIDDTNAHGGFRGRTPFESVMSTPGFSRYGWGLPEDDVPLLVIQRKPAGMVGYLGPDSRIMSAVVLQSEVPLINTASTPALIDELINPWVFRCRTNDPRQHEWLIDYLFQSLHRTRVALLRTGGPVSETHLNWWAAHARVRGHPPVVDWTVDSDADLAPLVQDLLRADVDAILTWCDARTSETILRQLRDAGLDAVFVGADEIVCDEFITQAGRDFGEVLAPFPCAHRMDRAAQANFMKQYARTWPHRATTADSYLDFDATSHLLEAVQIAGPDRDAIREVLRRMGEPALAYLEGGRWESCTLARTAP